MKRSAREDIPREVIEKHHRRTLELISLRRDLKSYGDFESRTYLDECSRLAWEFYIPEVVNKYHARKEQLESQGMSDERAGRLGWEEVSPRFAEDYRINYENAYINVDSGSPEEYAEEAWEHDLYESGMLYWERHYFIEDKKAEMAEVVGEQERDTWLVERRQELVNSGWHHNLAAYQTLSELYDFESPNEHFRRMLEEEKLRASQPPRRSKRRKL